MTLPEHFVEHPPVAALTNDAPLTIRPLETEADARAFRALNEEWISRYFSLEAKDRATLGDPQTTILNKGGHIYIVHLGEERVGCVALIADGDGVYELSKMAVAPHQRGLGIGRRLLEYTLAQARALDARSLYLGSSTRLKNAVLSTNRSALRTYHRSSCQRQSTRGRMYLCE